MEQTATVIVNGVDLVTEPLDLLVHPMNCFTPVYFSVYGILNSLKSFLFVMEGNELTAILIGHLLHPLFSGPQIACDIIRNKLSLRDFIQRLSICNTVS